MTAKEVIQNAGGEIRTKVGRRFSVQDALVRYEYPMSGDRVGEWREVVYCGQAMQDGEIDALLAEHERQLLAQFEEVVCHDCFGKGAIGIEDGDPFVCLTCNGTGHLFRKREAQS